MEKDLSSCEEGKEYKILKVDTEGDPEMESFLRTLGCYEEQRIAVISKLRKNYIIAIKEARYSIDEGLAKAIFI